MRPRRRLAALVLALPLAACSAGDSSTSTPCSPRPSPTVTAPSARAGSVTVAADSGLVEPGSSVTVTVHVDGPLQLVTDCSAPVELVVVDSSDVHVFADHPAAERGVPCGNVTLPPGGGADYELHWTPDATLPSGRYTAVVTVGSLTPVDLGIVLGHRQGEPC